MSREADTLFVAMTRPAMKWGVPYIGVRINTVFTVLFSAAIVGSPFAMLVWFPIHWIMRWRAAKDPHFFHNWVIWWHTRARTFGGVSDVWGGTRLAPAPSRVTRAGDVRFSV